VVVAPGSQDNARPSQSTPVATHHGTKRSADTSLESEQRLSKRFDLLNLGMMPAPPVGLCSATANMLARVENNGTRLYIPVASSSQSESAPPPKPVPVAPVKEKKRTRSRPAPTSTANDSMEVEDTPNRVYIHDLAAELSDIESDEENPIFLSDIEKHLAKIPRHVLLGPEPKATQDNQIVLYNVPSSLTLSEEQDSVKKAIVEARARVRERQANPVVEPERTLPVHTESREIPDLLLSPDDAMDID
jgi:hypothetical protein